MTLKTTDYRFSPVTLPVRSAFEFRSPDGRPFRNRSLHERLVHGARAGDTLKSQSIQ